MRPFTLLVIATTTLVYSAPSTARDLYVDNVRGLETNDGLAAEPGPNNRGPFKTIHRGLRTAQLGDTVHLSPSTNRPYHESAVFHNRECPADKPITLDGHGATITGAERVDLAEWELVEPGLYRKSKLLKHVDSAVVGRYFFRFDNAMQHMGRTSKGPSAKLKEPKDLQPGEWTFKAQGAGTPQSPYVDDTFYLKIDPAKQPSDYKIEYPARSSGVQVSGRNTNIVIRNLAVEHVYNDGFNIHGYSRGVLFENVAASECGDDGISAHDDCRITVRRFGSFGNSTGFCHTNESWSDSEDVEISDCLGFDVFVLGTGKHTLKNSRVLSSASSSVVVNGPAKGEPGHCTLEMDGVTVIRGGKNRQVRWMDGAIVSMKNCEISGFDIACSASELTLRDSRLVSIAKNAAGNVEVVGLNALTIAPTTNFSGANNIYDLKKIVRGELTVTRDNYVAEAAKLGDTGSQWKTILPTKTSEGPALPTTKTSPK